MKPKSNITLADAKRVLEVVDAGLSHGLGEPVPGEMCVEAAVSFALGLPHGDDPPCVSKAGKAYKIPLNDSAWSSPQARAKGMRRIAIAQLGSDGTDEREFVKELAFQITKQLLPPVFLSLAALPCLKSHREGLEKVAASCANAPDASAAASAARSAVESAASAASAAESAASAAASAAWSGKIRDKFLSLAADIGVVAFRKVGALGVEFLDKLLP